MQTKGLRLRGDEEDALLGAREKHHSPPCHAPTTPPALTYRRAVARDSLRSSGPGSTSCFFDLRPARASPLATWIRMPAPLRYFIEQGFELVVARVVRQESGLYGERAGCFHFVASPSLDAQEHHQPRRQPARHPPALGDQQPAHLWRAHCRHRAEDAAALFAEWRENLQSMSGRIIAMRKALRSKLEELWHPRQLESHHGPRSRCSASPA